MSTYKPDLTPREQAKYLSIASELAAAGMRVDIPDEWKENAHFLHITIADSPESLIIQISPTIVLYALRVRIMAEHAVTLQEFEVVTRWDSGIFPCYAQGRTPYRFAPGLDFDIKEVLNDRIESDLRLRRGDIREGWLLAMGNKSVPEEYGPGRPAPVEVTFFDQVGQSQGASVTLAVERSTQTRSKGRGLGLREREDPPVRIACDLDTDATVPLRTAPRVGTGSLGDPGHPGVTDELWIKRFAESPGTAEIDGVGFD
jgi:hypothetical protein